MNITGATYNHSKDYERLNGQLMQIFNLMIDGVPRTPDEVASELGLRNIPSVSAQLRNLRKRNLNIQRQDRDGIRGNSEYWYNGSIALTEPNANSDSQIGGSPRVAVCVQKLEASASEGGRGVAIGLVASTPHAHSCECGYPLVKTLFDGYMKCTNSRCNKHVKVS